MRRPDLAPVDITNPAARAAWVEDVTKLLADLHDLAVDAAAPKGRRRYSRAYLRSHVARGFRSMALHLAALDPAQPADGGP